MCCGNKLSLKSQKMRCGLWEIYVFVEEHRASAAHFQLQNVGPQVLSTHRGRVHGAK